MTDTPAPPAEEDTGTRVRPFADFLIEQAGGSSHAELSDGLKQLVARVLDTGKAGSIVYTVKVHPAKGDKTAVIVDDAIKLKLPEYERRTSNFFVDKDGNVSRDDPRQPHLPLRIAGVDVDTTTGEIRQTPPSPLRGAQ